MDTALVLLLLVGCCIQPVRSISTRSRHDEPHVCTSRFDFEEKLLEKMVKISQRFDMLTEEVNNELKKQDTRLSDIESKLKVPVLCTECPDAWVMFEGSCYKFAHDGMVFPHAEEYCRQHGGYLVHIETKTENMFIKTFLLDFDTNHDNFWIGMTDETVEGLWKWYGTNTSVNFTDWLPTEPQNYKNSEDCAAFGYNGRFGWMDVNCVTNRRPICEIRSGFPTSEIITG